VNFWATKDWVPAKAVNDAITNTIPARDRAPFIRLPSGFCIVLAITFFTFHPYNKPHRTGTHGELIPRAASGYWSWELASQQTEILETFSTKNWECTGVAIAWGTLATAATLDAETLILMGNLSLL